MNRQDMADRLAALRKTEEKLYPTDHELLKAQIAADVDKFLRAGNCISVIPNGMSNPPQAITSDMKKKAKMASLMAVRSRRDKAGMP